METSNKLSSQREFKFFVGFASRKNPVNFICKVQSELLRKTEIKQILAVSKTVLLHSNVVVSLKNRQKYSL